MTTWVVGDIHGCAEELSKLIERLALGPEDQLVSVGDLFHRGPDPVGVMELLAESRASFILGNHEHIVLRRLGLAPAGLDPAERPAHVADMSQLREEDLAGDGGEPCIVPADRRGAIVSFLQQHRGFCLRSGDLTGAHPLPDGRDWVCVHAGILPDRDPEECSITVLTSLRRLDEPGRPWWYEDYLGPDLVFFGHTPSKFPRVHRARGKLVALGLDTGCVYGGHLTAYSPDLGEYASVPATRAYSRA